LQPGLRHPSPSGRALRKGISVLGAGDLTHPAWRDELKGTLVPAEAGLLRLRPDRDLRRQVPAACEQPVRFMLSVEISTIYRRDELTRKVHHLIYAPTFGAADRITASLPKIGNVAPDGRPILGLDSRDLLEITLEAGPGRYLVPAHIWTLRSLFLVPGPVSTRSPTATATLPGNIRGGDRPVFGSAHELDVLIAGCLSARQ
jgi:PHP family Zn ribbon phosphoesterase